MPNPARATPLARRAPTPGALARRLRIALCAGAALVSAGATALDDNSQVPVLLYHSRNVGPTCSPDDTDVLAFERDVRILRQRGYVLRPLLEVVYWRLGIWRGDQLPEKVAAITFDDGFDRDWQSGIPSRVRYPAYPCADLPSVRGIAEGDGNIPVTFFVIASRAVREGIQPDHMNDNWWQSAARHYLFEIGNHSIDHDHQSVTHQLVDDDIGATLPASGHADGRWRGEDNPLRWTNHAAASLAVEQSARAIHSLTEQWPVLFAHPMGTASPYLHNVYFPQFQAQHGTLAAFCTEDGTSERLVRKSSDRWCLPRLGHGVSWVTGDDLNRLIDGWER